MTIKERYNAVLADARLGSLVSVEFYEYALIELEIGEVWESRSDDTTEVIRSHGGWLVCNSGTTRNSVGELICRGTDAIFCARALAAAQIAFERGERYADTHWATT